MEIEYPLSLAADPKHRMLGEIMEDAGGLPMTLPTTIEQLRAIVVLNYNRGVDNERERCAKLAENLIVPETGGLYCGCPQEIADLIRKGDD
jgi:hypothetical protein